ncbi:RING-H2 finger protein ATL32-like [Setaria italica]|nr:RING-H2 finger protein ATL32-like [Setaria italica]
MPLKLAMIVVPPLCMTCVVLKLAGVSWRTTAQVAAAMVVFVAVIGLCDRLRQRPSPWQQPAAGSMAAPPQEAVLGLGASAIASLPVYKYKKKTGGAGDECSVCLGEIKPKETVKQLPVCTHLFHEGCIDVWLRSHWTCPVCRTPVNAAAPVPATMEIGGHTQAN